jgi:elongation factor Ts
LREKGIAKATKKAGAIATEGVVKVVIENDLALILEINSQTDFVAMSDAFIQLSNEITLAVYKNKPASLQEANQLKINSGLTIEQACQELTAKIGEKTALRRFVFITKQSNQKFASYVHNNKKIAVVLCMNDVSNEVIGKDTAMHAAAMNPKFLNAKEVDQN